MPDSTRSTHPRPPLEEEGRKAWTPGSGNQIRDGRSCLGPDHRAPVEVRLLRVSLEVAVGFVVQLAMCHQFLHAGEGLGAAEGGTAEELAWQGRNEGQRSGEGWPRLAWRLCLLPTPNCLPTTYSGLTFQGLCGWAVGTQMLCQVANTGETETAARAGAGYLLPCRTHRKGGCHPLFPRPSCPEFCPRETYKRLELPYWFLTRAFTICFPHQTELPEGRGWVGWLVTVATACIHLVLSKW